MNATRRPVFADLSSLAAQVQDGDTVGVGGLHFCRIPVALLRAVIARQARHLHYVSWGGGMPLEMLLAGGCLDKLTFCFSSLDVFGMAPLFRRACEREEIEVCELNALAFIQGLHAAQQQLPSMPYQVPIGSDFNGVVADDPLTKTPVGAAAPLPIDVLLLHATRADTAGNVEIVGALGLDISLAWAARKILVTVEEVVPAGTLARGRGVLPRDIITAISLVPQGAWPSSSPTHYVADFRALASAFRTTPLEIPPGPSEDRQEFLKSAARLKPSQLSPAIMRKHRRGRSEVGEPATAAEIMIHHLAQEYTNASYCSAGAVSPLAIVSYLLAKQTHAPDLRIMTTSGGYVDIEARPMLMIGADTVDNQTATIVSGGEDTYHWFYQRGLVTHEVVSAAQIDRHARTNNQWLLKPDGTPVRLPGQGGMADVANMHANFVLYLTRHSPQSMVEKVFRCSAARGVFTPEERAAAGWANGKVLLVTDLCVCEVNPVTREWEVVSLHPGVTAEHLRQSTGFAIKIPEGVPETEVPDAEQLRRIREEIDPLGFRRLEFIPSRQRQELIDELIETEEGALSEMLAQPLNGTEIQDVFRRQKTL
jgi:glutaconate CoA-transferase subunit A